MTVTCQSLQQRTNQNSKQTRNLRQAREKSGKPFVSGVGCARDWLNRQCLTLIGFVTWHGFCEPIICSGCKKNNVLKTHVMQTTVVVVAFGIVKKNNIWNKSTNSGETEIL